jgi:hypothetical protein
MTAAMRMMEEYLKAVDGVMIVLDARAPRASLNRKLDKLFVNKKVLYVINKCDLVDVKDVKRTVIEFAEEGKEAVIEKTMTLFVNEPFYPEMYDDPMMEGMVEEQKKFPWWGYAIIGAAVAGAAAAAVLVMKKKKKAKKLAEEEMELINSLEDNE